MEDNNFPVSSDYGIPEVLEKPAKDLIALKRWYTTHPSNDNAIMVAEMVLELFVATDAYINAF